MNACLLDFSNYSIKEILFLSSKYPELKDVFSFLEEFNSNETLNCYTSGTTGTPKKVEIKKTKMILSAQNTLDFFKLKHSNSALLALSANHIAGKMMLVRAIVGKLKLYVIPPTSDPLEMDIPQMDFCPLVPLQLYQLLERYPIEKLRKLGTLLIGGGKINFTSTEKLKSAGINCFASFGMTETLSHFALRRIAPEFEEAYTTLDCFKVGSTESKQLILKENPITEQQLITNDLVELLDESRFIWLGRKDNVINTGGLKVFPERIEEKLSSNINQNFFIASENSEKFGEQVILVVEGPEYNLMSQLITIKPFFSKGEFPKEIYFLNKFPLTETGKIKRKEALNLVHPKL